MFWGTDLDDAVGEDAVAAPSSDAGDPGEFGAVPAIASFQVIDPSFGADAPIDLVTKGAPVFELATCDAAFAGAWSRHAAHARACSSRSTDA